MPTSQHILDHFRTSYAKDIDLTLRPAYRNLLEKLGSPHHHLPPVFHVAGTNGKGSTCAFLRAILEAAGKTVHVYTSPHLVHFNERIRVAGQLISEEALTGILQECLDLAEPAGVSYFEAATAAALVAFARTPADFTILEVGLGGRLDATNVIPNPIATIITRLSFDHRDYLGDTMTAIAQEKAGIMKPNAPCFTAPQPSDEAVATLRRLAASINAPLRLGGIDWRVTQQADHFTFTDANRSVTLPRPALNGDHQVLNAGLAIAALSVLPEALDATTLAAGMRNVSWPARMQRLTMGNLVALLPKGWELWLDGGHNDSAGDVVAAHLAHTQSHTIPQQPCHIITGMLSTKVPDEFLRPLAPYVQDAMTVTIPDEPLSLTAEALALRAQSCGIAKIMPAADLPSAIRDIIARSTTPTGKILICGSLYLAGHTLALNGDRLH